MMDVLEGLQGHMVKIRYRRGGQWSFAEKGFLQRYDEETIELIQKGRIVRLDRTAIQIFEVCES